jgi:xanthine/CO dehydrogenase XdhC/CoxF family maturation factor
MNPSILDSNSRTKYWETVSSLLNSGQYVFLAMVAEHTTHSPGTTGAKLLVAKERKPVGTIGGGIMEYNLIKRANDLLENKPICIIFVTLKKMVKLWTESFII